MHFSLAERRRKEKEKKKEKKRPSSNGFVTHAVRLRAYAISPCLRLPHCFSFFLALFLSLSLSPSVFRRRTSLQVALRAFPSPFPPFVLAVVYNLSFWLGRESRNRGIAAALAESPRTGCPRWSNGTLSPRVSQRSARARARVQCASPAALSRIISRIYTAALPLSRTRFT